MPILLVVLLIWLAPAALLGVLLGISILRERRLRAAGPSSPADDRKPRSEKQRDDPEKEKPQEQRGGDQDDQTPPPQLHAAKVGHEIHE